MRLRNRTIFRKDKKCRSEFLHSKFLHELQVLSDIASHSYEAWYFLSFTFSTQGNSLQGSPKWSVWLFFFFKVSCLGGFLIFSTQGSLIQSKKKKKSELRRAATPPSRRHTTSYHSVFFVLTISAILSAYYNSGQFMLTLNQTRDAALG